MDLVIRHGRIDDVAALLAFWLVAVEGTDRHDGPAKVAALIERDPEAVLIAEAGGQMAGTLIAGWDGWQAHLYRLAVDPAYRRRGVGTALTEAARSPPSARSGRMPWCCTATSTRIAHGIRPATPSNLSGGAGSSR